MITIIYDLNDGVSMRSVASMDIGGMDWSDAENPFPPVRNCFYVIFNNYEVLPWLELPSPASQSASSGSSSGVEIGKKANFANSVPVKTAGTRVVKSDKPVYSNSYIGIAGKSLRKRFKSRCEAVVHLGIESSYMNAITVWWGRVYVFGRPGAGAGAASENKEKIYGRGIASDLPGREDLGEEIKCDSRTRTVVINGKMKNLEHLLIRFYVMGAGGGLQTNTNTIYAKKKFLNNTGDSLRVVVRYAGVDNYPPGKFEKIIASDASL